MGIHEATSLSIIILSYKDPYSGMRKNRMECGVVLHKTWLGGHILAMLNGFVKLKLAEKFTISKTIFSAVARYDGTSDVFCYSLNSYWANVVIVW